MFNRRAALCAIAMGGGLACAGLPVHAADAARARADTAAETVSADARYALQRVLRTGDHRSRPFAIVDKRDARMHVFTPAGRLVASTPVLLGVARGDHAVPGIGELPVERIPAAHRTTPAGRFATEPGRNLDGEDIVWLDYDAGLAIHRVRAGAAREARLQRLAAGRPHAQRVSAGCVVVPVRFYETHVQPLLGTRAGVVYVLPETRSVQEMFAAADGA